MSFKIIAVEDVKGGKVYEIANLPDGVMKDLPYVLDPSKILGVLSNENVWEILETVNMLARHGNHPMGENEELVNAMQKALANIKISTGTTPFHVAVKERNLGQIMKLVSLGVDVNDKDSWGLTPIFYAIDSFDNNLAITSFLRRHGAEINIKSKTGFTPLMAAAELNDFSDPKNYLLEYLIKEGAIINERNDLGETALMISIKKLRPGAVKMLIDAGAALLPTYAGTTPIMRINDINTVGKESQIKEIKEMLAAFNSNA